MASSKAWVTVTGKPGADQVEEYTQLVYSLTVLRAVVLSKQAQKDLLKVPKHVAVKLQDWVEDVEERVDKHVY